MVPRPQGAARRHRGVRERNILVLDLVCILGIVALGAVVALVGRAVEKL